MRNLWEKWNGINLIVRIATFLVAGTIVALIAPQLQWIGILGTLFVGALKAVAPVLVFFLVISSLANAKTDGSMSTIVILYCISTLVAALVAVLASYAFPIELTLTGMEAASDSHPEGISEILNTLMMNLVANPVDALTNANYLGILTWGILLGIALRCAATATKDVFRNVSDAIGHIVRWVINLAPFGIFGLVYTAVSTHGMEIFTEYGILILVLVGCMAFIAFVTNPLIVFICTRKNPYPLVLRTLRESFITAFFTRSSAANIPVNMELCRKLKLNEDNYSVSIPLGATINMGGAAVTITVMAMAACHTLGISVDIPTAVILCVLASVSACGVSGVAGGSLLLIPVACSLFGIPNEIAMQVVAVGFIIGVIQDSCETGLNSSSDVVFTATAEYYGMRKAGKEIDFSVWEK